MLRRGAALALVFGGCLDPHYPKGPERGENASGDGSRGADSSRPGSSSRDDGGAPTRDAEPNRSDPNATPGSDAASGTVNPDTGEPGHPEASVGARPDAAVAELPVGTMVPGWAMPLLGRYATRWFTFKQDEYATVVRAEQLAIVEFALEGRGMILRSKFCLATAVTNIAELRLVDPSVLPERLEQVTFSELERSWATEGPTYAAGFTIAQPDICAGKQGQKVPKMQAQVWLAGSTCRCSSPGEAPLIDDCRILDPDRDQEAGVTYTLKGLTSTLGNTIIYAATESDSHFVNGKVGVDGAAPAADVALVDRNYQLDCEPTGCANITALGKSCPISFNHALFVKLAPGQTTTCAELSSNVNALFPARAPAFPARCLE